MTKKNIISFCLLLLFVALLPYVSSAAAVAGVEISDTYNTGLSNMLIKDILTKVLDWLLSVIGIVALIGFVISGGQYILANGDEKMMEKGKRNMVYSIIGIVVVLGSFVVVQAIDSMLRGSSTF